MTNRLKSVFFCSAQFFCLLALTACADTPWPEWITGEPDNTVLNAPHRVGEAPSKDLQEWPNLASVPAKPKNFSTLNERQAMIKQMMTDKAEAEALRQQIANEPQPTPIPRAEAPVTGE